MPHSRVLLGCETCRDWRPAWGDIGVSDNGPIMTIDAYRHITDNIEDFKTTAVLVESDIKRLGLCYDRNDVVYGMDGRLHCDMWGSMKTVSHFNIEISLELTLKLVLRMNEISVPTGRLGHMLSHLFDSLPSKCRRHLEQSYQKNRKSPEDMVGTASVNSPTPPSLPAMELSNLRGFLVYLDEYVKLWEKRYSWESVDRGHWRHYLLDISVLVELINDVLRDTQKYFGDS